LGLWWAVGTLKRSVEFIVLGLVLVFGVVLTTIARRLGGPSTDRFVNVDPTRGDFPLVTNQRASELSETDQSDEPRRS